MAGIATEPDLSTAAVSRIGLPVVRVSSPAIALVRARSRSAARGSTRPRSTGISAAHRTCAALAPAILASSAAGVVTGIVAIASPVAGLIGDGIIGPAIGAEDDGRRLAIWLSTKAVSRACAPGKTAALNAT